MFAVRGSKMSPTLKALSNVRPSRSVTCDANFSFEISSGCRLWLGSSSQHVCEPEMRQDLCGTGEMLWWWDEELNQGFIYFPKIAPTSWLALSKARLIIRQVRFRRTKKITKVKVEVGKCETLKNCKILSMCASWLNPKSFVGKFTSLFLMWYFHPKLSSGGSSKYNRLIRFCLEACWKPI